MEFKQGKCRLGLIIIAIALLHKAYAEKWKKYLMDII